MKLLKTPIYHAAGEGDDVFLVETFALDMFDDALAVFAFTSDFGRKAGEELMAAFGFEYLVKTAEVNVNEDLFTLSTITVSKNGKIPKLLETMSEDCVAPIVIAKEEQCQELKKKLGEACVPVFENWGLIETYPALKQRKYSYSHGHKTYTLDWPVTLLCIDAFRGVNIELPANVITKVYALNWVKDFIDLEQMANRSNRFNNEVPTIVVIGVGSSPAGYDKANKESSIYYDHNQKPLCGDIREKAEYLEEYAEWLSGASMSLKMKQSKMAGVNKKAEDKYATKEQLAEAFKARIGIMTQGKEESPDQSQLPARTTRHSNKSKKQGAESEFSGKRTRDNANFEESDNDGYDDDGDKSEGEIESADELQELVKDAFKGKKSGKQSACPLKGKYKRQKNN